MAEEIPQQWAERARYDLDTARAMLDTGRYLYVLFCCQQAVEKMLKAVIAERSGQCPPRLHNLLRLAEQAGVTLDQSQTVLMEDLSRYYIQSRYPEEIPALSRGLDRQRGEQVLGQTEGVLQWLSSML
jgi:HEPN domain-containing protein